MPETGSCTSVFIKLLLKKSGGCSLCPVVRVVHVVWAGWEINMSSMLVSITRAKPTLSHYSSEESILFLRSQGAERRL